MKECIVPSAAIVNTARRSDQFSVNENVPEINLLLTYRKGTETGMRIQVEYAPNADGIWSLMSDTAGIGVNPLTPWTLRLTADAQATFPLKLTNYGFYRIVYWSENVGAPYGTFEAYVIRDVQYERVDRTGFGN